MKQADPPARIPPIEATAKTEEIDDIIGLFAGPGRLSVNDNPVLNTLVHHPEMARHFLTFNRYLLMESKLPVRLRQIAIMRVAWIRGARYVWSSHLRTSLRNGLSGEEFEPIKLGPECDYWNEEERIILFAADQMTKTGDLDDATWDNLCRYLDRQQVLDLCLPSVPMPCLARSAMRYVLSERGICWRWRSASVHPPCLSEVAIAAHNYLFPIGGSAL